jgi:hypothetical protein
MALPGLLQIEREGTGGSFVIQVAVCGPGPMVGCFILDEKVKSPQHAGRRSARQALRASWPVLEVADALHALCRHGRNAQQRHTRCCLKSSEKPEVGLLHTG